MKDFLTHLIGRNWSPESHIRPRLGSLFEPPPLTGPPPPDPTETAADTPPGDGEDTVRIDASPLPPESLQSSPTSAAARNGEKFSKPVFQARQPAAPAAPDAHAPHWNHYPLENSEPQTIGEHSVPSGSPALFSEMPEPPAANPPGTSMDRPGLHFQPRPNIALPPQQRDRLGQKTSPARPEALPADGRRENRTAAQADEASRQAATEARQSFFPEDTERTALRQQADRPAADSSAVAAVPPPPDRDQPRHRSQSNSALGSNVLQDFRNSGLPEHPEATAAEAAPVRPQPLLPVDDKRLSLPPWRMPGQPEAAGAAHRREPVPQPVRVTIGRIEVRAQIQGEPGPSPQPARQPRPALSLAAYLRNREGGS